MAVHWQVSFKSLRADELYTVSIYDDSYYGNPVQLKGGAQPFETSEDISDDWFLPVRTQSGYLRIVDDGKDAYGNTLSSNDSWQQIIPEEAKSRKVVLTDYNGDVRWQGYLQPQTFSGQLYEDVQEREFPIVCGLSVLGGIEPALSDGLITFAGLLSSILLETGISYDRVYFQGIDPIYWLGKKIDWSNLAVFDDDHHRIPKYSCFEILEEICKFWGWTCRTCGSYIYFVSPDEQFDVDFIYMTLQDLGSIDIGFYPHYDEEQFDAVDTDDEVYASTDNHVEILRGIKKGTVRCDFNKRDEIISVPFEEISEKFRAADVGYTQQGNIYHFYKEYNGSYFSISEYENDSVSIECYYDQSIIAGRFIAFEDYDGVLADKHNYNFNYVLNAYGNQNSVSEACMKMVSRLAHSFNDGALTINADLLDAPDTASITAYLQVGDMCWNGSQWVAASSQATFTITIKSNKFEDNRVLDGPYDAYTGYGVPINGLGGLVDFRIVNAFDGIGGFTLNFTSLSIGFVKERTKALNSSKSQNVYTESTGAVFTDEQTVDLIFATNNLNSYGLGFVMDEDGAYTYDVPYSYSSSIEYERPEEHLLSRLISRGASIKGKEVISIRQELIDLTPLSLCATSRMSAYPVSISHEWRDDVIKAILLERAGHGPSPVPPTPGRLPAGYTELAYLESTGTQYINMACAVDKSLFFGIEADIWALHPNNNKYGVFSANPYQQFLSEFYSYNSSTNSNLFTSTVGTLSTSGGWGAVVGEKTHLILSTEGKTINGNYISLSRPLTADITNFRLFGSYKNSNRYPIKIGEFKITGGTTLMRDLVPAMRDSDSVVGMYDLVSNTFLTNAGSGTFSYGTL